MNRILCLFCVLVLWPDAPVLAQLDTIHRIPPCHARSNRGQQYLYLSTPEATPFQVNISTGTGSPVTDGNGVVLTSITLSNASPQRIYLGNGDAFPNDNLVTLTRADQLHMPLDDKGIVLQATRPFYANFRTRTQDQAGSLTAKGSAALGTSFRIGHVFNKTVAGFNTTSRSNFFSVMATEPNTTLTVSGFAPGIALQTGATTFSPSGSYTVFLQAGQCYVTSTYVDQGHPVANETGLIGSWVESDKPVVVNCGTWLGSPFDYDLKDIGIDQIVPVDQVGTEYITIRGDGHVELETPIVVATADLTEVYLNGSSTPYATLNAGQFVRIPSTQYTPAENMYIRASQPVYTYQMLGGADFEPTGGLNFVPPLRCSDESVIDHIMDIDMIGNTVYEGKLLILAETGKKVAVNGNQLSPALFKPVTGHPGYVTYKAPNLSGSVKVVSDGALQIGVFGRNNYAGWAGYFSGFDKVEHPRIAISLRSSCADTLRLKNLEHADSVVWIKDEFPLPGSNDSLLTGVVPGEYYAVAFREICGEWLWDTSARVVIPEPLGIAFSTTPVTCPEIASGSFAIDSVTGGYPPYAWSLDNGQSYAQVSGLTSLGPGIYPVLVRDSLGCVHADSAVIHLEPDVPLVSLSAPLPLSCTDTLVDILLTGTSADPWMNGLWTGPAGSFAAALTVPLSVSSPGTYVLSVTNTKNGCLRADTVIVLQDTVAPVALVAMPGLLTCTDTLVWLEVAGVQPPNATWQWTTIGGQVQGSGTGLLLPVTVPGQYVLMVTDPSNGCTQAILRAVVADDDPPELDLSPPSVLTCVVGGFWLSAQGVPTGDGTWTWTGPGGLVVPGMPDSLWIDQPGQYALTVAGAGNGCVSRDSVTVLQDLVVPMVDAGIGDTLSCLDTVALITGVVTDCPGCQSVWQLPDGSTASFPGILTTKLDGWFVLEARNPMNGCQRSDSVQVVRIPAPETMSAIVVQPDCQDTDGSVAFGPVAGGLPPYQYSFDGGSTFGPVTILDPAPTGPIHLVVRDQTGCTLRLDTLLADLVLPSLWITPQVDLAYGESWEISVTINIPPQDVQSVHWTPSSGLSCTSCLEPTASPEATTVYSVVVTDRNGCTAEAEIRIDVALDIRVFIPDAFHPDGNGINDGFTVFADPEKVIRITDLQIFDRWGNAVFRTRDIPVNRTDLGWDGSYRGKPMDPAVFVYVVEVELVTGERRTYAGGAQLVR